MSVPEHVLVGLGIPVLFGGLIEAFARWRKWI